MSEVTQSCPTPTTPWTAVYQAPPSMEFSRQEYWSGLRSGLPFLSPGDLPDPGIEPRSPALQADALPSEPPGKFLSSPPGRVKERQLTKQGGVCPPSWERRLSVTSGNWDKVMRVDADRRLQAPEAGSADVVKWLLVLAACFWTQSSVISEPKLL